MIACAGESGDVDVPDGYRVRTRAGYFAPRPAPIHTSMEFRVTDPVSIVLDLDSSGSMKNSAAAVQAAARDFVAAVRPEDLLALITFADTPVFGHALATNRQWTVDAIGKYVALGGTALYDSLWDSLMILKDVPGRHAIVVLTDGRDENNPGTAPGSLHTLAEVMKFGRSVGAMMFPIGLGPKVEREVLDRLAAESGGTAYYASDSGALSDQFRQIIDNLRRRYVLGYTSTNSTHDGTWRTIDIRPRDGKSSVASLGGYFAPDR